MITCAGFYWYYWLRFIRSLLPATASLIDACLKKKTPDFYRAFFLWLFFRQAFTNRMIYSVMLGLTRVFCT